MEHTQHTQATRATQDMEHGREMLHLQHMENVQHSQHTPHMQYMDHVRMRSNLIPFRSPRADRLQEQIQPTVYLTVSGTVKSVEVDSGL